MIFSEAMSIAAENTITYHESEEYFYKFINQKNLAPDFKKYLIQFLKTFECVETGRSKKIYQKNSKKALWDIHLPNPGIKGKNAFRMLCVIDEEEKQITLINLFHREDLPYKGTKNKRGDQRWNNCIQETKQVYF